MGVHANKKGCWHPRIAPGFGRYPLASYAVAREPAQFLGPHPLDVVERSLVSIAGWMLIVNCLLLQNLIIRTAERTNMRTVAVDVGGTHTDLYAWLDGEATSEKVPTVPDDPTQGVLDALDRAEVDLSSIGYFLHGSTITTNALIEGEFPRTAFVTTDGYRDVTEIGRYHREKLYDPYQQKPDPLVPRRHRYVVPERIESDGEVRDPLDGETLTELAETLGAGDFESVAIGFINSYANPDHERRAAETLREQTDLYVARSSEILPVLGTLDRFSTTIVNAALAPLMRDYLNRLRERLSAHGFDGQFFVITSNGGVLGADQTIAHAEMTVLSGPAAGAKGAGFVGDAINRSDVIGMDMGGTSTDVSLVEDGEPLTTTEFEVKFDVPISVPMVDVTTIGSGGGTISWIDDGGSLRIGPKSAGADPGPACYPSGGSAPTITDANLLLGRLNPEYFLGGDMSLDREAAEAAIATLADRLGLDPMKTAHGIIEIANENMASAIRELTIDRGRDPRDYVLVGFGGCGPMHAVGVAQSLGIPQIVVPFSPGVLSAYAGTRMDLQYDAETSFHASVTEADPETMNARLNEVESRATEPLVDDQSQLGTIEVSRVAEMRYVGQTYELDVPLPDGSTDRNTIDAAAERFHEIHEREYGISNRSFDVEFVSVRAHASAALSETSEAPEAAGSGETDSRSRSVYFDGEWIETAVYDRLGLGAGTRLKTPAIVEDETATIVIEPGAEAWVDTSGNVVIDTEAVA